MSMIGKLRQVSEFELAKFKKNLVDQICEAAGGPCKYKGKSMKDAHKGMGISTADFNALVGDLVAALDKAGVPNQLITLKGRGHGGFSREEMASGYIAIREFLRKNNVLKGE